MNTRELQYNYAKVEPPTFRCSACFTCSYEIPLEEYIPVPDPIGAYMDKYYNMNGDKMWYWDAEFTKLWVECPSHNM